MFRVKVCGVTRVEDAQHAARCGADAVGINFYEKSPRRATIEQAAAIGATLDASGALAVGVLVNASDELIARATAEAALGALQLHGDEPPERVLELPDGVPVLRAFRMDERGLAPAADYAERCVTLGRPLAGVLIDGAAGAAYGGAGKRADWGQIAAQRGLLGQTPLLLAGGLNAENVGEAIAAVRPHGVDTASGVESAPGVKDPARVEAFVSSALRAYKA